MVFRVSNKAVLLLEKFIKSGTQSRALLLLGKNGWGKFSSGIDFAQAILKTNPLLSSDFFCFRNDHFRLKTEFFLTKKSNSVQSWEWLYLLQRRINLSKLLDESLPSGVKLASSKETLDEYIALHQFPVDEKFINQLIMIADAFDKKSGIPINIIREAVKFHSIHTNSGRISLLGNFDTADEASQNAALKLLEEPHPNHWLLLTAEHEKSIIPTILSRTIKIHFTEPSYSELAFLGEPVYPCSSINIMKEELYHLSKIKIELLDKFFNQSINQVDKNINYLQFAEYLHKENLSQLFLEELLLCFEDSLILRQNYLRGINLPIRMPQYQEFSSKFHKATVAELEELVSMINSTKQQVNRSVIKADALLPPLFLELARTLIKIQ